jgi:hypothetical protein
LISVPTTWASPPALLCEGIFSELFFQAGIQLQSSWVARITSMSHHDMLKGFFLDYFFLCLIENLFRICASRCSSHSWWSMVSWVTCHECDRIHLKIVLF